jgi:hypothetical protein
MEKYKRKPAAGDILLCGVMRWVGALEVVERSNDRRYYATRAGGFSEARVSADDGRILRLSSANRVNPTGFGVSADCLSKVSPRIN